MTNETVEELTVGITEIVRAEIGKQPATERPAAPAPAGAAAAEPHEGEPVRLPRRIQGGFQGLTSDLEKRAREWTLVNRLLEQQRPILEAAEAERDRLLERLGRVVADAHAATNSLKMALETTKAGDVSGDLAAQFGRNLQALEALEGAAEDLVVNLHVIRASWEPYARTVIRGQRLRDEIRT